MSDHSGLRYLFDQPNLNVRKSIWLAMNNEFNFQIKYIKGKENRVAYALSNQIQVNHITNMSSFGTYLQDMILQADQQDVRYMELRHILQQSTGTSTGIGSGIDIGAGVHDVDYCLAIEKLVRFRDRIYVPDNSELKKVILRDFHVKPYLGHPGYQKILTAVKRFYYWPNIRRYVSEFMAKCQVPILLVQSLIVVVQPPYCYFCTPVVPILLLLCPIKPHYCYCWPLDYYCQVGQDYIMTPWIPIYRKQVFSFESSKNFSFM